ncbi:hypothetical protein IW261DRAFT_1498671, partial [Armillaria novae-zelandiae]
MDAYLLLIATATIRVVHVQAGVMMVGDRKEGMIGVSDRPLRPTPSMHARRILHLDARATESSSSKPRLKSWRSNSSTLHSQWRPLLDLND